MRASVFGVLMLVAGSAVIITGCPNKNSPSSPSGNTPTPNIPPCMNAQQTPCTPTVTSTPINTPDTLFTTYTPIGGPAYFSYPAGIQYSYSNSNLWVVDYGNNTFQEWSPSGSSPMTTVTSYNSGQYFDNPWGDGIDPSTGNVYVADGNYGNTANMQGVVFNSTGLYLNIFGNAQLGGSTEAGPDGVVVNSSGTTAYLVGENTNTVYIYSISGTSPQTYTYRSSFGASGSAPATIDDPYNIHLDGNGNVWVASYDDASAKEYSSSGTFMQSFTSPQLGDVTDLVVDSNGNVYVTDDDNDFVLVFNSSGTVSGQFGAGILNSPEGITTDGTNFYVSDSGNMRIFMFGP